MPKPAKSAFNGLLTNDKCCTTRYAHLQLGWSRYDLHLRHQALNRADYLPDEIPNQGGSYDQQNQTMAHSTASHSTSGRSMSLGSSLSELALVEPTQYDHCTAPAELCAKPTTGGA